ncbi:MAG: hypothetical protein AAF702_01710 [Chloroflexota bacterium]
MYKRLAGYLPRKKVATLFLAIALLAGVFMIPADTAQAQSNWCRQTASWAGINGWQGRYNPNYEVWFAVDTGRTEHYIYFRNSYVSGRHLAPQGFENGQTRFGISTRWAVRQHGETNPQLWHIDFRC